MFNSIRNAFKVKELRAKLLYTFMMLVVIRFGSQLPIPGVETSFFADWFAKQTTDVFGFFNAMTGGSFSQMSVFALSITPYITSSIILQLLTIAIPTLEEMHKDEDGRKKIQQYTRCVTVGLAVLESGAMAIGFGRQGFLIDYNAWSIIVAVATMTAGSALLMWIGEQITEKGVGNGISIVLLFNILSSIPTDIRNLYYEFVFGQVIAVQAIRLLIIFAVIVAMVVFVIVLNDAQRNIPVQYSKKMVGRKLVGGQASSIPLKVNTAGVMPVIFASSIMSFPVVIAQFFSVDYNTTGGKILMMLNSGSWCNPDQPIYSIGLLVYIVLIVMFAYFYTSIAFNPLEVANNMKKQGGFIPGIRPGRPTSDYLSHILNYIVLIGAVGLIVVSVVPIVVSGVFSMSRLSFAGTSLIIIVSVVLETIKSIESQMLVRYYKGFLND